MKTREVAAKDLKVGMVIVAKGSQRRVEIVSIMAGMGGPHCPYLTVKDLATEMTSDHDTGFDSRSATYTVEERDGQAET